MSQKSSSKIGRNKNLSLTEKRDGVITEACLPAGRGTEGTEGTDDMEELSDCRVWWRPAVKSVLGDQ